MLTRRRFLELASVAGAAALLRQGPVGASVENLYFVDGSADLGGGTLERIAQETRHLFAGAGIGLRNVEITRPGDRSPLTGLDLAVYFLPGGDDIGGEFGLGGEAGEEDVVRYRRFCEEVDDQYPLDTVQARVARVYPEDILGKLREPERYLHRDEAIERLRRNDWDGIGYRVLYSEEEQLHPDHIQAMTNTLVARVVAHEIGHGLGAGHLCMPPEYSFRYIMEGYGESALWEGVRFNRFMAERMRGFIRDVKANEPADDRELFERMWASFNESSSC